MISIHAPTRGATQSDCGTHALKLFQSTLPHGERPYGIQTHNISDGFQSTLPHGERPQKISENTINIIFQSTLPHGERRWGGRTHSNNRYFNPRSHTGSDALHLFHRLFYYNFNPRSHTGSDSFISDTSNPLTISIHAPTRGATRLSLSHYFHTCISIHAPTRGATKSGGMHLRLSIFQSTLPHGERLRLYSQKSIKYHFNPRSHTGSDSTQYTKLSHVVLFQSTLPHGERQLLTKCCAIHQKFQSTLPHGERPVFIDSRVCDDAFQSTLPHGERPTTGYRFARVSWISIHAPTRGATVCCAIYAPLIRFQSTLPHGERHISLYWIVRYCRISIHAPTRGATKISTSSFVLFTFQSTLPHGERPFLITYGIFCKIISIHAPTRGATGK